jgi:iron complex transport system substrate-binding protein
MHRQGVETSVLSLLGSFCWIEAQPPKESERLCRIVNDGLFVVAPDEVVARKPDLIVGSWCGKKFRPERVAARPGFSRTPAVQKQHIYEIKSSLILPGPAALTDGLAALQDIIERWATRC